MRRRTLLLSVIAAVVLVLGRGTALAKPPPPAPVPVSGYQVVSAEGNGSANAFCPAGKHVLGGGGNVAGNGANLGFLIETAPLTVGGLDGWRVATWGTSIPVALHAICAYAQPSSD